MAELFDQTPGFIAGLVAGVVVPWLVQRYLPFALRRMRLEKGLDVFVETDPHIFESGMPDWIPYNFLFPGPPEQLPEPPPVNGSAQDWWSWAHENGGIDAHSTKVQVTLIGRHEDTTVVVDAITVELLDSHEPEGTFVVRPTGGADLVPKGLEVDLDLMPTPTYRYRDEGGETTYSMSFSLAKGEVQRVQIEAIAHRLLCKWTANLHLIVDGARQTITVDKGRVPFETVGVDVPNQYIWDGAWKHLSL